MTTEAMQPDEVSSGSAFQAQELLKRLQEETELGTVLVGVAYISEYFRRLFDTTQNEGNHVNETQIELSLRENMASALAANWITQDDHADLEHIIEIKKYFVRHLDEASFRDDEIHAECEGLKCPEKLYPGEDLPARDDFVVAVSQIVEALASAKA
ncbi:hypothetical protein ACFL1X_04755 [Candidatus Hydrogenedentota bacterium]